MPGHATNSISWVDWYSKTPDSILGTLILGDQRIEVTFSGPYHHVFLDALPEPLWGPPSTYTSSTVGNAPPNKDVIVIAGGPENLSLSFSQAVPQMVMAIGSLGLLNSDGSIRLTGALHMQQSFDILSNGPNYYSSLSAGGQWTRFSEPLPKVLSGVESSGTIRMRGTHDTVEWTALAREEDANGVLVGTHFLTIGAHCNDYRIGPNPLVSASSVPAGCTAQNFDAFQQQAQLDVRGTLDNRGLGSWTQGAALRVAPGGSLISGSAFTVGELQELLVEGALNVAGPMQVRGTVVLRSQENAHIGGNLTLKGDNSLPEGGMLQVDAGSRLRQAGQWLLEDRSRARIGGALESSGPVQVNDYATFEVLASGNWEIFGPVQVIGSLSNRGTVRVANSGQLVFQRDFAFDGQPSLLDNQGTIHVAHGGLFRVHGDPEQMTGGHTEMRHGAAGTLQVEGTLQVDGLLTNAGRVLVGTGGRMINGDRGSFAQIAGGSLESTGIVEVQQGGLIVLGGHSLVRRSLSSQDGGSIEVPADGQLEVRNGGLESGGSLVNRGRVLLAGAETQADPNIHSSDGRLDNKGLLRIAPDARLVVTGAAINTGRLVVDGRLDFVGSQLLQQHPGGVLVNNGRITSPEDFIVSGGRLTGRGTWDVPRVEMGVVLGEIEFLPPEETGNVTFGEITFEPPPEVGPGQSPGTLTFTGGLKLHPGVRVAMEFSENDGADRLVVGGLFEARGATMRLLFTGEGRPGLDQVFDFLETQGGIPSDMTVEGSAGLRLDTFARGASAGGLPVLGIAFAPDGTMRLGQQNMSQTVFIGSGESWVVEEALQGHGSTVWNAGSVGVRNLPDAALDVARLRNQQGAEFLNSAQVTVRDGIENAGVIKNRAGATLVSQGTLENQAFGVIENRGTLRTEGVGRIVNRGHFIVQGDLYNGADRDGGFRPSIVNDGGVFEVAGTVRTEESYWQLGAAAQTRVDGILEAPAIDIEGGVLSGAGMLVGALRVTTGARLEPGNSPGTLAVQGSLLLDQGEILIELAGAGLHDRLLVSQDATLLNGTVRFRLLDGYVPAANTFVDWIEAGSGLSWSDGLVWLLEAADASGAYNLVADASGLHDPQGLFAAGMRVDFHGSQLAFTAAPVPEPLTWAMMLAGLAGVGAAARRRGAFRRPGIARAVAVLR